MKFEPGQTYRAVFFSSAAYCLPFHLGVVKCFREKNIHFEKCYGVSSGALAALAMLGGADLDLIIRQIFDLSEQNLFFSYYYSFKLMLCYFDKSRENNHLDLSKINSNLHIGLFDIKTFKKFFKNKFTSEDDLKISMILSANVTPFMSLFPYFYENGLYIDPIFINAKLEHNAFDLAVTPYTFSFHLPESESYIKGSAEFWKSLFCDEKRMKRLFCEGYFKAKILVKESLSFKQNILSYNHPELLIDEILDRKKNWKLDTGFIYYKEIEKGKFSVVEICEPEYKWDKMLLWFKNSNSLAKLFICFLITIVWFSLIYMCLIFIIQAF